MRGNAHAMQQTRDEADHPAGYPNHPLPEPTATNYGRTAMPTSTSTIRCKRAAGLGSVVVPGRDEIERFTFSQSLRDEGTGTRLPSDHWLERYHQVRNQTMDLVATLTPEDQMVQSMPDATATKDYTSSGKKEDRIIPEAPSGTDFVKDKTGGDYDHK